MTKEQGNAKLKDLYRQITQKAIKTDVETSTDETKPLKKEVASSNTNNTDKYWITYGEPVRSKLVSFKEAINIQNVYPDVMIVKVSEPPIEKVTTPKPDTVEKNLVSDNNPVKDNNITNQEARHSTIDVLVEIPDVEVKRQVTEPKHPATKKKHHGRRRDRKKSHAIPVAADEFRVTLPEETDSISESQLLSAVMRSQNQIAHIETDESKFSNFKTVPVNYLEQSEKKRFSFLHFFKGENLRHTQEQVS